MLEPIKAKWNGTNLEVFNFPEHLKHWSWTDRIPKCWVPKITIVHDGEIMQTTFVSTLTDWEYLEFELNLPYMEEFVERTFGKNNPLVRYRFDIILK